MRPARMTAGLAACALVALLAGQPAAASEPTVWLNIEVTEGLSDMPKVRINVPISMVEVIVSSLDTAHIFEDLHSHHGIDLANLWRNLREADTDEFLRIDTDEALIQVFKDAETLRMVVQESGYDEPNVQVRIPFAVMDYVVEGKEMGEFRLSELVERLRDQLPLMMVEAVQRDQSVRIWLEER